MPRHPTMGTTLGETLMKVLAGGCTISALLGALIVPMAVGHAVWGPNWGATAGCAGSAILLLGIGSIFNRFPGIPGAAIAEMICANCLALMTMFVPVGAAIELIDDRATATWTGIAIGIAILVAGILVLRRLGRARAPRPSQQRVAGVTSGGNASNWQSG